MDWKTHFKDEKQLNRQQVYSTVLDIQLRRSSTYIYVSTCDLQVKWQFCSRFAFCLGHLRERENFLLLYDSVCDASISFIHRMWYRKTRRWRSITILHLRWAKVSSLWANRVASASRLTRTSSTYFRRIRSTSPNSSLRCLRAAQQSSWSLRSSRCTITRRTNARNTSCWSCSRRLWKRKSSS